MSANCHSLAIERHGTDRRAGMTPADLILRHSALVRKIAFHLVRRLPDHVDVNDLMQAGIVGLLDAARRFTGGKGSSFETYAGFRIRGEMLDSLRQGSWTPRRLHRQLRQIAEATRRLEGETGEAARAVELAAAAGLALGEYHRIVRDAEACQTLSLELIRSREDEEDSQGYQADCVDAANDIEEQQSRRVLSAAIGALPETERVVILLHYNEERLFREIGDQLGLSESRISQIHHRALERLRTAVRDWMRSDLVRNVLQQQPGGAMLVGGTLRARRAGR